MTTPALPIIVGTDGSPSAGRAVEWAAAEAARRGCPLHIVHAVRTGKHRLAITPDLWSAKALAEAGQPILRHAAELATKTADVTITSELAYDSPVSALRGQAGHAAEIVVGHRGLGGFTGLLLGSTGLKIAGRTPCPAVIIRGGTGGNRDEVLAGVDPEDAAHVLDYAFRRAAERGSTLRAVHVWLIPPTVFNGAHPAAVRQALATAHERLTATVAPYRSRFPQVNVIEEAPPGHPVEKLIECSARADLLVVGAAHHGAGPFGSVGSVSHGVIHHADSPVAIVPA